VSERERERERERVITTTIITTIIILESGNQEETNKKSEREREGACIYGGSKSRYAKEERDKQYFLFSRKGSRMRATFTIGMHVLA
jgi:hypothetical protein